MSGLDPVGRRDVRELIRRLHAQGRTILFSSHILSDAETLCSRVTILAKGRVAAAGSLRELLSENVRGWELIVRELPDAARSAMAANERAATPLSDGTWHIALDAATRPEPVIAELAAHGAMLVSATPQIETLEDVFVRRIAAAGDARAGEPR
jgi:ABC-2 type transport system ATP-binding protein